MNNRTINMLKEKRILVVDDIPENSLLVKAQLATKPYEVISVTSGKEALEMIQSYKPDLILLDIMMPEMDGFEVLNLIRNNPLTSHLPVIMLTAYVDKDQKNQALSMGANGYLAKPLIMRELHEALQQLFESH